MCIILLLQNSPTTDLLRPIMEAAAFKFEIQCGDPAASRRKLARFLLREGNTSIYGKSRNLLTTLIEFSWLAEKECDLLKVVEDWFVTPEFHSHHIGHCDPYDRSYCECRATYFYLPFESV